MKTLNDMKIGQPVRVTDVLGDGALRRHILDMGVTKGADVTIKKAAPLGDPLQISVRGYELSLRRDDAKLILVEA
jgi:ferrous iron transport protein A